MTKTTQQLNNSTTQQSEIEQPEVVISVKNVSKKFCKTLKRSMAYGIIDLSKNLVGMRPDSSELRKDEFWAVKDLSFELKKGEVLGLIGVNGSGKSTALRLLTGIFPPDKGEIMVKGRIGALIAVGAGFHPHMTGRENTYLNGTILGMSREEIDSKFEDIVSFSEVGDFIDAPVSTYSSGMRVRLGFSIATAIEPDILIVDEVLAVGDAGFRTKALNRMREVMADSAVIFVSHAMPQIARISTRVMVMKSGTGTMYDDPEVAVNDYLGMFESEQQTDEWFDGSNRLGDVEIRQIDKPVSVLKDTENGVTIEYGKPFCISMEASIEPEFTDLEVHVQFIDNELNTVLVYNSVLQKHRIKNPNSSFRVKIDFKKMILFPGKFFLNINIMDIPSQRILARKWYSALFRIRGSIHGGRYPKIGDEVSISCDE